VLASLPSRSWISRRLVLFSALSCMSSHGSA
jgi:hypothetical protein